MERHRESTSLLFLILADLGVLPGKVVKLIHQRELTNVCFIRWRSRGATGRTKGREKEEVGGRAWDRQLWPSHLCVRSSDSPGAGKPFHQSRREGISPHHKVDNGAQESVQSW